MKNLGFAILSIGFGFLLFSNGALAAQELPMFAEEQALAKDFGSESPDAAEDLFSASTTESDSADQVAPLSAGPPSMNMLSGFVQFFFLVALFVTVLFGWLLYRKHRLEQFERYNDWD